MGNTVGAADGWSVIIVAVVGWAVGACDKVVIAFGEEGLGDEVELGEDALAVGTNVDGEDVLLSFVGKRGGCGASVVLLVGAAAGGNTVKVGWPVGWWVGWSVGWSVSGLVLSQAGDPSHSLGL